MHILDFWTELAECKSRDVFKSVTVVDQDGNDGEILRVREFSDAVRLEVVLPPPDVTLAMALPVIRAEDDWEVVHLGDRNGLPDKLRDALAKLFPDADDELHLHEKWISLVEAARVEA